MYRIEVKPVDQSTLESLNLEVICFLLCAVFWMLKTICHCSRLAKYSDLHYDLKQCKIIYSFVNINLHLNLHMETWACTGMMAWRHLEIRVQDLLTRRERFFLK